MHILHTLQSTPGHKTVQSKRMLVLIFIALLFVSLGLGIWRSDIGHADVSGTMRVRTYSTDAGSQTALAGVAGQVYTIIPCSGHPLTIPVSTNGSGLFTYQYNTGCGGGNDAIFCLPTQSFSKAGYTTLSASIDSGNANTGAAGCGSIVNSLLSFTVLLTPNPTLDFNASSTSITNGSAATLSWNSPQATTCNATAGGINTAGAKSGSVSVKPTQSTTYTIKCDKSGTPSVTKSVTITVTAAPAASTKKPTNTTAPKSPANSSVPPSTDKTAPSTPQDVHAVRSTSASALITWKASTDETAVASYILERSTDSVNWEAIAKDIRTTSHEDTTVSHDTTQYWYRVSAVDTAGNQSEFSAPSGLVATDSANQNDQKEKSFATDTDETLQAKNSSSLKIFGILSIIGVIAAGVAGAWWYRRGRASTQINYDQYTQQSPPTSPANPPLEPVAPHTSKSLKDMVLEDLDAAQHKGPGPQPPLPPQ